MTDCALALGYLDPGFFLGGRLRLALAAARRAIAQHVGEPLGLPVEAAAQAVLDLLTQAMVAAIEEITVNQGIDPTETAFIAGGGAGGLNCVAIARRLGCRRTLVPEPGAALAASRRRSPPGWYVSPRSGLLRRPRLATNPRLGTNPAFRS